MHVVWLYKRNVYDHTKIINLPKAISIYAAYNLQHELLSEVGSDQAVVVDNANGYRFGITVNHWVIIYPPISDHTELIPQSQF